MNFVYNLVTYIGQVLIFCAQPFSTKLKLFYRGRKGVFDRIDQFKRTHEIQLWIHVASLGEYEQGRPIIEEYKKLHPSHKVLLSVFSCRVKMLSLTIENCSIRNRRSWAVVRMLRSFEG